MELSFCFFSCMHFVLWLSLFHLTLANFTSSKQSLCHDNERYALLQFKQSLIIKNSACGNSSAYPKIASWKAKEENGDCCSWDGIICDEDTGYVIRLDLTNSCLSGSINSSSSLFHLNNLEWLSLVHNDFYYSNIPSGIMNLSRLAHLDLSYSGFSGQVPHILVNLSLLSYLSLEGCNLKGEFPTEIFQLPNLYLLSVLDNPDLSGHLPEFEKIYPLEELRLRGTKFSGAIPDSIEKLKSLSYLDIGRCYFSGTIPSSLGNLTHIRHLDLSFNKFSGQNSRSLSWMAKHGKLIFLELSETSLVGEIPSWLMNLTHLTHLYINGNKLTGLIPYGLMNLTQMRVLELASNQLHGPIPSSISQLKNLEMLELNRNHLSGTLDLDMLLHELKSLHTLILSSNNLSLLTNTNVQINFRKFQLVGLRSCNVHEFPDFLKNQDQLKVLDLSSNEIAGQIPGWLLNVSIGSLVYLNLSHNFLTGFDQHPVVLPWSCLSSFDLSFNELQGRLPIPPVSTQYFLVSHNKLSGEIPSVICNLNHLEVLDLSNNHLSGVLPKCFGNFSYLSTLNLKSNKFLGSFSQSFMNGTKLRMIDLSHNLLQGRIPRSLGNCTMLEFLNLGNNQINDIFPYWLGTLPELKVLVLQSNRFDGVIMEPKINCAFPKLRIIDLSHNRFTGNLPSKYFQCWNAMKAVNSSQLTYMQEKTDALYIAFDGTYDYSLKMSPKGTELEYGKISTTLVAIIFSNNNFEGEIPASIANLTGLLFLNLSNNNLQGCIPSFMGNLIALEALDLSNNMFSGQIPRQLADQLTFLSYFNVSHNHLKGPIPQGKQFETFENVSFDGNPELCGKPLSKKCGKVDTSEKGEAAGSESAFAFGWKIVLTGYASGLIIGVILGHIFTRRKHELFVKIFGMQLKKKNREEEKT